MQVPVEALPQLQAECMSIEVNAVNIVGVKEDAAARTEREEAFSTLCGICQPIDCQLQYACGLYRKCGGCGSLRAGKTCGLQAVPCARLVVQEVCVELEIDRRTLLCCYLNPYVEPCELRKVSKQAC